MAETRALVVGFVGTILFAAMVHGEDTPANADAILDDLGHKTFLWFQAARHPKTGLILDRLPNKADARPDPERRAMASIASVGYFLSLLPEWVRLHYLTREEAVKQANQTIDFIRRHVGGHEGVRYHFVDWKTGQRWARAEVSPLDSSILFNGAMVAAEAFGDPLARSVDELLDGVDWTKFIVTNPNTRKQVLSFGWSPEKGLFGPIDVRSSELSMPFFLAVGSRTHPVDPALYYHTPVVRGEVCGYQVLNPKHPLFTSHYGLSWHGLTKGETDRDGIDFAANAEAAARANREYCRRSAGKHRTYAESEGGWWGISAGDSPTGYRAPGPVDNEPEGVVWPMTSLAAVTWVPDVVKADLALWHSSKTWTKVAGPYGLAPFRLDVGAQWQGPDLIGIDVGSFAVNLANHRDRTVSDLWRHHPVARAAIKQLDFRQR